jgi:hypothetical protein
VVLLGLAVAAGLIVGLARRPAGLHSTRPRVECTSLLGAGAVLNAASVLLSGSLATLALIASLAVLVTFTVANRHLTGVAVVGVGLLLNLVAVSVNAGMPVRAGALEAARLTDTAVDAELSGPRHLETAEDPLPVLGDVLPVPFAHEVVSFGDLIVVAGAADAVRELSRRRARRQVRAAGGYPADRMASASVDQLWGTAPRGAPVSATQCSANPERATPISIELESDDAVERSPALVAASHSR